jgi:proline iminopeptidase
MHRSMRVVAACGLAMVVVACAAGGGAGAVAWAGPAAPDGPGKTFTTPGGARIWYDVRGTAGGRPLVMVNGGPGFDHQYVLCSDAWDTLARTRRVVLYDQRGNGKSGALAKGESCTLADQIADLEALREKIGADQIDLLGHSWGGYLVIAYSARYPQHIAHLCIIDSASPKWTDTDFIFKYIFPEGVEDQGRLDFFDGLGDTLAGKQSLNEYMGMLFVSTAKRDEFLSHSANYHYARSVNETLNGDLGKFDMWPALAAFKMPTLVACGRYDINVAPSTAWKIHKAIAGSRWQVFEKSGHLPYFEEPELFVSTINDFLGAP